tara:strand:- start:2413 stop:3177 length:765 start_codon:yes stop_codon:yes gene_type:complete
MSNVIEKKPPQHNVAETIAEELFERFGKNTPIQLNKDFPRTAKPKVFDKMSIQLSTSGIEEKNVENYYNQIKSNRYVARKGMYLVCRDLFDAKVNLSNTDYESLLSMLGYSQASVYKQESIGSDYRLFKMFNQGRLPESWTTQYALTQFNDEEFMRVIQDKNINHQSTLAEIKKVAKVSSPTSEKLELLGIGSVKVNKDKVNVAEINKFEKSLKKFMNDYKFVTVEFANDFKNKIKDFVEKRDSKDRQSNEIAA